MLKPGRSSLTLSVPLQAPTPVTNLDVYSEPYLIHRQVDLIQCFYFNENSPLSTPGYLLHFADLPQEIIGGDQLMKE